MLTSQSLRVRVGATTLAAIALSFAAAGCGGHSGATPPSQIAAAARPQGALPIEPGAAFHNYRTVYNFGNAPDGTNPVAPLLTINGTLYGTTTFGGMHDFGTVYSVTPAGSESVLYSFGGGTDGEQPAAGLIDVNGTLYGTTSTSNNVAECGAVYSVTTAGAEKVLYFFDLPPDGCHPIFGSLTNANGVLYGTTYRGGDSSGNGVVFNVTVAGLEKVKHIFAGATSDGANPAGGLLDVGGTLYGTTQHGGKHDLGTVFSRSPTGTMKILHSFAGGNDGKDPDAGVIDVNGTLYGTTFDGGKNNDGTVFSVTTAGVERIVHAFRASDGRNPFSKPVAVNGNLYGTTSAGGTLGGGTVYKLTMAGTLTVLHPFGKTGDGSAPQARLVDVNGTLYGTTSLGGSSHGSGTVFAISP